ncbi:MAG: eIF2A-related protein [Actinomycetota bacterium]
MARYALVVGICQYRSPNLRPLEKTTIDAEAVAQVLEQYGDFTEVKRLPSRLNPETKKREMVNKPVTSKELAKALETLLQEQARGNEALIYFTGHGLKVTGFFGKPTGYLATSDCEIKVEGDRIADLQGGISFEELNTLIHESELSKLIVLFDCCHSGYLLERHLMERSFNFSLQKDYYLITACRGFQEGKALKSEEHSVFTGALLNGLKPEAADSEGGISCDRLYDFISRQLRGSSQEPLRLGWGSSIIFVKYPPLIVPPVVSESAQGTLKRENPYLGLRAFDVDEQEYFFGRETAVRALVDRIKDNRFLAVIGPSGSGKSSLVKAGLFPELGRDRIPGSSQWPIESMKPGDRPLILLQERLLKHAETNQPYVLFIDQFEEVFTLCKDKTERHDFIRAITEEARVPERQTRVIVTVRGDFIEQCAEYPEVAVLINGEQPKTYFVTSMSLEELKDAIEKPASLHGVALEPGLVSQIIDDVDHQAGALPLLQYALKELWRVCIEESTTEQLLLTKAGYEQIGGVKGALENQANFVYNSLIPSDQKFVWVLFRELVEVEEGKLPARRRAARERLAEIAASQEQFQRVVGRLADQRLIVTNAETVEVAHEALLSEWSVLRNWIQENTENLRFSHRLEEAYQEWCKFGKSEQALLSGALLNVLQEWQERTQFPLPTQDAEFLQKSLELRDRELKVELEQQRKRTRLAIASLTIMTALTMLTGTAWINAERGQILALSQASEAKFILNRNSLDPLVEALKAGTRLKQISWVPGNNELREQVMETLTQAVYWVRESDRIKVHNNIVQSVSFSPDGTMLASAGYDHTIKLWKIEGNKKKLIPLKVKLQHSQTVFAVTFSPDSQTIASASFDRTVKLWNRDGTPKGYPLVHSNRVYTVAFNPKGDKIATGDRNGTVTIWDLKENKKTEFKNAHKGIVYSLSFSPDGSLLATGSKDNTAKLWTLDPTAKNKEKLLIHHSDIVSSVSFSSNGEIASASLDGTVKRWRTDGSLLPELKGENGFTSVAFSPNGKMIVAGRVDNKVQLWDQNGKEIGTLEGHTDRVNSVSFSHDGTTLASASNDQTVKLWQTQLPLLRHLRAHNQRVMDVSFRPDGKIFASASEDATIKLWDIHGNFQQLLKGHNLLVDNVSFSPNSDKIVSTSRDDTVKIWTRQEKGYKQEKRNPIFTRSSTLGDSSVSFNPDLKKSLIIVADTQGIVWFIDTNGNKIKHPLQAHKSPIFKLIFSPDGKSFATASDDGTVKIWNEGGKLQHILKEHTSGVEYVSFSRDGNRIATASQDSTVKLWDRNGNLLKTLTGHSATVTSVSFSPDGDKIATASNDRTIKLWKLDGTLITTLKGHNNTVNAVTFHPYNGNILISGSSDTTIIIWSLENLTLEGLLKRGCEHLHNYLGSESQGLKNICK